MFDDRKLKNQRRLHMWRVQYVAVKTRSAHTRAKARSPFDADEKIAEERAYFDVSVITKQIGAS